MTSEIKNKILTLRDKGYGYKKISIELNMPISSVRYVCVVKDRANELRGTCLNCGKSIKSIPHKKAKKFCSDRCRWEWWNEQRKVKKSG